MLVAIRHRPRSHISTGAAAFIGRDPRDGSAGILAGILVLQGPGANAVILMQLLRARRVRLARSRLAAVREPGRRWRRNRPSRVWRNAPSRTEAARLSAALLDQFGATVKPGKVETLDIDDTFCAAHGGQQLAFWNAHHDERGFASMHIYHVASGTPVAAILRPARTPKGSEVCSCTRRSWRRIACRVTARPPIRCGSSSRAPILISRSRMVANSHLASGLLRGIAARTPCISQNAATAQTLPNGSRNDLA